MNSIKGGLGRTPDRLARSLHSGPFLFPGGMNHRDTESAEGGGVEGGRFLDEVYVLFPISSVVLSCYHYSLRSYPVACRLQQSGDLDKDAESAEGGRSEGVKRLGFDEGYVLFLISSVVLSYYH